MDPYEQRLRDEVIYLHSLWHKGPPRNPNPNPRPKSNPVIALHQPSNSPSFKNNGTTTNTTNASTSSKNKNKKKKKKKTKPKHQNKENVSDPPPENSDIQWQSETPVEECPTSPSGWPPLKPPQSGTRLLSAEEQAKMIPAQMQQKGLEASRLFFLKNCGSDGDEEDEDEDEVDEDEDMDDDCEECEEYKFFLKLFMDDGELRVYYEKNSESGDFYCLVCGGIGKKVWKRYKNCVAVVQHSTAIAKTAKRRAHRAFGQVICKVLGWDINRLPTIVLSVDDTLSQSLAKIDDSEVDPNGNADGGNDNLSNQKEDSDVCRDIVLGDCSTVSLNVATNELVAAEIASKGGDVNTHVEDSSEGISDLATNTEGLMNCSKMLEYGGGAVPKELNKIETEIIDLEDLKKDGAIQNRELLDNEVAEAPKQSQLQRELNMQQQSKDAYSDEN